jgi:nitrate reductase gamma subunit
MSCKWVWVILWVALAVCPVAILLIGEGYRGEYKNYEWEQKPPTPLGVRLLGPLMLTHLGLSVVSVRVILNMLNFSKRGYATCLVVLAILVVTVCVWLYALMLVGFRIDL